VRTSAFDSCAAGDDGDFTGTLIASTAAGRAVAPPRVRQRVRDFARVLGRRFPTVQDHRTLCWGKTVLR
jgi:hypothetical protein